MQCLDIQFHILALIPPEFVTLSRSFNFYKIKESSAFMLTFINLFLKGINELNVISTINFFLCYVMLA